MYLSSLPLHLKTKFLLPGAWLNRKKATDIPVLYGRTDNGGFIWAGLQTKSLPSPLGRTADLNRPSFAKRRVEGKLPVCCRSPYQSRVDLPYGKSRLIVLWDGRADRIACWLRARMDGCLESVLVRRAECEDVSLGGLPVCV
jgi:hypothetical protein